MRLKRWICFVVILAVVLATMPTLSHAASFQNHGNMAQGDSAVTSDQSSARAHTGCVSQHGQDGQKTVVKQEKSEKSTCCDDRVCQCMGGVCSGVAKLFGTSGGFELIPSRATKARFLIDDVAAATHHYSRIKRPPRS